MLNPNRQVPLLGNVGLSGRARLRKQDISCLGVSDEELEARIKRDGLRALDQCPVVRESDMHNVQFHWVSQWTFWRCFGAVDPSSVADGSIWSMLYMATRTNEPVYSDFSTGSEFSAGAWHDAHNAGMSYICISSGPTVNTPPWYACHSASEEIETHTITSESWTNGFVGLRAIYRTVRFLWMPWQCVCATMNSIYLCGTLETTSWSSPWDGYGNAREYPFARIRIKEGGVPVTWSKTNRETILLDYTMRLVSM